MVCPSLTRSFSLIFSIYKLRKREQVRVFFVYIEDKEERTMRYLPNAAQMKEADNYTIETLRVPSVELMERAAMSCVAAMVERKLDLSDILIVCGSGNNGGDGFAIGRILSGMGYQVTVYMAGNWDHCSKDCEYQARLLEKTGGLLCNEYPEGEYSIIVDAIFGVGLKRQVAGTYAEVIGRMNASDAFKAAVDLPSGISADTGCVLGTAFRADLTVTFQAEKCGLALYPGKEYAGEVAVADIGISLEPFAARQDVAYTYNKEEYSKLLPKRLQDSHKGTFGRLLVIAGSKGMSGAAYLNARAAYQAGAGLVQIYTAEANRVILQTLLPEAIVTAYQKFDKEELLRLLAWADVVCIGSGIGAGKKSAKILKTVLKHTEVPCVVDADGINLLASHPQYMEYLLKKDCILTPHMKEMSRLTGVETDKIKESRIEFLKDYTKKYGLTCILKDSRTVISSDGKRACINLSGNSAMAKAGSGDVLAGLTAGLLAQGLSCSDAAVLGVYLHGKSGDYAREKKGSYSVSATDLTEYLGDVLKEQEEMRDEKLYENLRQN